MDARPIDHPADPIDQRSVYHLAVTCLARLRQEHPFWTIEIVCRELDLPDVPWLKRVAEQVGFRSAPPDGDPVQARVVGLAQSGVWSDAIISLETGVPLPIVQDILAQARGYGADAFGVSPYGGGNRSLSNGKKAVLRRVTVVGQMSYRGKIYSLGMPYRGRIASVVEHGPVLIVSFTDRPALRLAARHYAPPS